MVKCVKCGRSYLFIPYKWESTFYHTEWNGQPICLTCFDQLSSEHIALIGKRNIAEKKVDSSTSLPNCEYCAFSSNKSENTLLKDWTCTKFGFDLTNRLHLAENCTSYITQKDYEKKCLSGEIEKEKQPVQIILDFSSLKDVMSKGGMVMTTYKCPNCNGTVNIPETGKVLICQYCNTPIKPVDIFEKIKSLL